ncbi:MAG TPA: lamin tail domain-containing protein, partial [Verrucomicrobiae bacterium]
DARYNGMVAAGAGIASAQGIKDFIAAKRNVVLSAIAAAQSTFSVTSNGGADFSTNRNLITLTGTAPLEVRTILINGIAYPLSWTSLSNWVIRYPLVSGANTLLITGIDSKGVPVSAVNKTIHVTYTGANELPQDKIVINEIMYNPVFASAGYVEIYNNSLSNAFDMSGWRLDGVGYTFPLGTIINPGSFIVLVKDKTIFASVYGTGIVAFDQYPGNLQNDGETLTLVKPGATPDLDQIIDQVSYSSAAPWPADANGLGASLQLIDPSQDNNRVSNWAALATNAPPPAAQWRYVTATGPATTSTIYIYPTTPGDVYIDDIKLVAGSVPEVGANTLANGDFESAFPGSWGVSANLTSSAISTTVKHSGNASLHVVATSGGTTRASAIYQDITPALTTNGTYTLSYWVLAGSNGAPLTLRLSGSTSGSGIFSAVNVFPPGQGPGQTPVRFTPGSPNSVKTNIAAYPTIWLNEVLPNNVALNTNAIKDSFGEFDPWVEIYNGGTNTVDLTGMFLANSYTNVAQWSFPSNSLLPAKQFMIVWLDGQPGQTTNGELHTSFRIAPDTGSVVLSRGTNMASIIDYLNYNVPTPGRSFGSYPDGAVSDRRLFASVTPTGTNNPSFPPIDVRINEWMADNIGSLADPADGHYEDWFELYNPGTNAVDLTGYYLTDSFTNKTQFAIPSGTSISAGGFLLVWADNTPSQNSPFRTDLHANFSLSKSGEYIALFAPDGTLIDGVNFGPQITDVSQGRFPDGGATLYFMTNITPRASNFIPGANTPPNVAAINDKVVDEGTLLSFSVVASDTDVPAQTLSYSLDPGAPAGASMNSTNGLFTWTPSEDQGPGIYTLTIRVTDSGSFPASTGRSFQVTVNEVNNAPVLTPINGAAVDENNTFTFTATATDSDNPPQNLTFSLGQGAPSGANINPTNGVFSWTPTELQGPGTYNISVIVTDDGVPPRSDSKSFTVTVNEVNSPPSLSFPANWTVHAEAHMTFTAVASDSDLPPQTLTFSLPGNPPPGAAIDPATGVFGWTPTSAQLGTNLIFVKVADNATPVGFNIRQLQVIVLPAIRASITQGSNSVSISFGTLTGRTYRVEYKNDLADTNWTALSTNAAGSATSMTIQDNLGASAQRFYRVREN